jgi:DAACS family dicarboxylate/amino acid:cation (Na+ or H+) symporter
VAGNQSLKKLPLTIQTLIAMVLGIGLGLVLGERAAALGVVGKAIISLIKAFATPLLFFAILDTWVRSQFEVRGLVMMLAVSLFNAACALTIALGINQLFHPGKYLVLPSSFPPAPKAFADVKNLGVLDGLFGFVPDNLISPFATNAIPSVIILAIVLGVGINRLKSNKKEYASLGVSFENGTHAAFRLMQQVLERIVHLVPFAVLAAVAQSVGTQGFAAFKGLAVYLVVTLAGMFIHIAVVYQAWVGVFSRVGLRKFWKFASEPAIHGAGINSSLATLPITLRSLDKMGVSPTAARLSACVGTNFNNDGILLYEAVAVLFIAQAYGIELSWAQQLTACGVCLFAAFGVAGVPEAGVIGLALVLNQVGVPTEILPLLLTVDWIVARCRSLTNVLGDMTVATVLDRME